MRSHTPLPLLLLLESALALKLPFHVRHGVHPNPLRRRVSISGASNATDGNGTIPIANTANAFYISNITLGGVVKPVMLDTGSSDLWVTGDVPGTKDLGKSLTLNYAVGAATGDINTATLTFDDYTVQDQAYLLVTDTSSFSADIVSEGYVGLVGLGPNSGSSIYDKVDDSSADTMINRIFSQNGTSSNYISFILDRQGDPTETLTGQLTISEIVPGLENITTMEKLDVETVRKLTKQDQHWSILLDTDGLIGPDGNVIEHDSIVHGVPDGQLAAVIDSGFTLPQVPRKVSDAIYGRVQGAEYDSTSEMWLIPCEQEVNLTLKLGGLLFPVHPLDTSMTGFGTKFSDGSEACAGTFQPITSAFSLLGEYDMILGMAFLRNAYTLLDYGDWVEGSSSSQGDPFVQLLPLTTPAEAHSDFVQKRLGGVDTTIALLPASEGQASPESKAEKEQHLKGEVLRNWPYIFLGCLALVGIFVGLIVWKFCCKRRRQAAKAAKAAKGGELPFPGATGKSQKYQSLSETPPPMHMQNLSSGNLRGYQEDPYRSRS